ncbi:hypothetical protein MMON44395_00065 [Mycolicibacterium monacense DSM 44395]|nr:hypothetical protein [Mycolicibacterium monacense DSM 44395]
MLIVATTEQISNVYGVLGFRRLPPRVRRPHPLSKFPEFVIRQLSEVLLDSQP